MNEHIYIYICGNCARFAPQREQSIDWGSDAALRCRRPLPFPLTCQHRHNISRRVEVYGSRKQRGSMTQTTTTVSAGMPARMQKSIDRESDAASRCRRPLLFPLTCQHRRNISRRVEVYGSRYQRGSMTQTTTTVSAGIPARMQKSMDHGDAAPRCRQPLPFPLTCQHRRNITKGRSPWIKEGTRLHDADDHFCFRRHASKNAEVYGSGRRGSTMQTTTAVSADVPAQTQHITKGRSLWIEEATRLHDADNLYSFRGHSSKNAEVYGLGKRRGSTMQPCREEAPIPCRA